MLRLKEIMWQKQSLTVKLIFVVVFILITFNVILVSAIMWNINSTTGLGENNGTSVTSNVTEIDRQKCTTPVCLTVSSILLNSLDQTVDPCHSFYEFVCQGFKNNAIVPNDEHYVTNTFATREKIEIKFNELLNSPISSADPKYFKMMKTYYRSCKNKQFIETSALETLHDILKKLGGWPILEGENWNETEFDWMETLLKAKKIGLPYDFYLRLDPNSQKLHIREGEANDSLYGVFYKHFLRDMAKILGASVSDEAVVEQINDIERFDKMFNNKRIFYPIVKNVTLRQLENSTFPWLKYLENFLSSDIEISPDMDIIYEVQDNKSNFVEVLSDLLRTTTKRVQANALIWQIVQWTVPYLNEESFMKQVEFNSLDGTATELRPRWKECMTRVVEKFKVGSTAIYSKKFLKKDVRPKITDIVRYIINDIKKQSVDQVSQFEKLAESLKDVDETKFYVGFPDQVLNESEVDAYYENLELVGDNYLNLTLNLNIFIQNRKYSSFRDSRFDWVEFVSVFDVDFKPEVIMTPVHLYNIMYFQKSIPQYINFGFLEEIIKPMYNKAYETHEVKLKHCHETYYPNSYVLDGTYLAYLNFVKNSTQSSETLSGFENYTHSQMFFISYGTSRCIKRRQNFLLSDEANEHFVNIDTRNSKYFSKIFNCPKGSLMKPEEDVCVNKYYPF